MIDPYIYVGLAGDTDPGRFLSAGLFRRTAASDRWESLASRFDEAVEVRCILTDARRPGFLLIGTQRGVLASEDHGEHWRLLHSPRSSRAVWSLARLPGEAGALVAGYEPCALYFSQDSGASWTGGAVNVRHPDITAAGHVPKRVTGIAGCEFDRDCLYATLEVGGLLRSDDGGQTWRSIIDGVYVADDALDLHAVVADARQPRSVTVATRVGLFRSGDCGEHWRKLPVPVQTDRGVYCRSFACAPDDPATLYLGAGDGFEGDNGVFLISRDDGETWDAPQHPVVLKSAVFAIATDVRQPSRVAFASKYGDVLLSEDRGHTWASLPLPRGVGHVFSLALG